TLLEILPLVLAAALSPTSLVMVITILGGKGDARRNSLLFVTGGAIFLVLFGLAVMLVFNHVVIRLTIRGGFPSGSTSSSAPRSSCSCSVRFSARRNRTGKIRLATAPTWSSGS
ncbi:MAG: hypothetical protein ACYC1B_08245, partial [Thermoleophilia bacterium]